VLSTPKIHEFLPGWLPTKFDPKCLARVRLAREQPLYYWSAPREDREVQEGPARDVDDEATWAKAADEAQPMSQSREGCAANESEDRPQEHVLVGGVLAACACHHDRPALIAST